MYTLDNRAEYLEMFRADYPRTHDFILTVNSVSAELTALAYLGVMVSTKKLDTVEQIAETLEYANQLPSGVYREMIDALTPGFDADAMTLTVPNWEILVSLLYWAAITYELLTYR